MRAVLLTMTRISVYSGQSREDMELILSEKDQKWGGLKEYTANRSKKELIKIPGCPEKSTKTED